MQSFLEPKPKFGITPFLNQIILYRYSLYPNEFETTVKNRRTGENRRLAFWT